MRHHNSAHAGDFLVMIHTETKFAYRHKPSGKWCYLETHKNNTNVDLHLIDDFNSDILYKARNIIEEDFIRGFINSKRDSKQFPDFEIVEIDIQYKIKNEQAGDYIRG